jgi:ubiquinone/menaquinone biosynthesis C-methylase UbiE
VSRPRPASDRDPRRVAGPDIVETYRKGLGISESFVQMASGYAKKESVKVHFIHGSAADIPLEEGFFDLVVCRAAFKNFTEPLKALKRNASRAEARRQGCGH